jgi:hypothetical protein
MSNKSIKKQKEWENIGIFFFSHTFLVISSMSGVVSSSFGTTFRDMLPRKQACILDTALVNSVK